MEAGSGCPAIRACSLLPFGLLFSFCLLSFPLPRAWAAPLPQVAQPAAASSGSGAQPPAPAASPTGCTAKVAQHASDLPFAGQRELSSDELVQQVLSRNPSLAQMMAVWQAAAARYPQVISLDDPMLQGDLGPGSFGSSKVDFAYRLELSQKYPFPGKRALRGQSALAEASAAGHDVEDTRLRLIETAKHAFYDYYLVERALAVNAQAVRLLQEFRENAAARYKTGLAVEQELLQADVEIGRQRERQLTLEALRQVAVARVNTLLHLSPDSPLPPPPQELALDPALPAAPQLRALAVAQRPDVQALADRIRAEQAALGLARKEFYPDFEALAAYDAFWQEKELRPMIGLRLNLPLRRARRYGAIAEAEARIAQRAAELARLTDDVQFQVQEAYEQARKTERIVELYRKTILRAAQANVQSAQSAYVTGKIPFLSLIEAERGVVNLQDRYYEAVAEYFRSRATLERVIGGSLQAVPTASAGELRSKDR